MKSLILSACRSAVVPRNGAFATLEVHELAAPVIGAALGHAGLEPGDVDELILSNAIGGGGNPARVAALAAGLPETVAGLSIDRQCAGGMDAILLAHQMIASGMAEVVVAGGAESYSCRPLRYRTYADGREPVFYDQPPFTPWPDRDPDMAAAAEALGRAMGITRGQADAWAVQSHQKARQSASPEDELVMLQGVDADPFTRNLTDKLCARAAVICGDVTAANTAVAADAAAFCVVVSENRARAWRGNAVEILGGATLGAAPETPGLAPVVAIERALSQAGIAACDLAAGDVMEAYAVQAIACVEAAGLDPAIVNTGGGALARGHPIGASGAINVVRLFHTLQARGGTGLATIAAAGGIGSALVLAAR